jgi:PAS domain S-box-containing protein
MKLAVESDLTEILAAVTRDTHDAVIITDLDEKIVWVNDGFSYFTGYTREEVIGKKPNMFQGPNTNSETREKLRNAIRERKPINVDIINYSKKGNPYWLKLNIKPYRKDGEIIGFIATETDMTDYYSPHKEETMAELRTNNMHSEIVSHDSINLLSNVIYSVQELKEEVSDVTKIASLDNILIITHEVISMLRDILTTEKHSSNPTIDVPQLISQCIRYYSHRCDQKNINVITMLEPACMIFPKNHMITIINTLLSNAIKFTENGTITVSLTDNGHKFTITDTGIGIPQEQLDKLFISNDSRKGTGGEIGKGIGLVLLFKLINQYNGKINVSSIVGKCTTFTIELPNQN